MSQLQDKLMLLETNVKTVSERVKFLNRENKELKEEIDLLKEKLRNSGGLFEANENNTEPADKSAYNKQIDDCINQIDECIALIDSQ